MSPDSRATILGPPPDWGEKKLTVPVFASVPVKAWTSGVPFIVSLALHVLAALCVPVIARNLPQDPDKVRAAQSLPPLRAVLILRMPERVYLPVKGALQNALNPQSPAARRAAPGRNPAGGKQAGSASSSAARAARQTLALPILIQPGKPVRFDPRTLKMPSLLYLSESRATLPQAPVVPGAKTPSTSVPGIVIAAQPANAASLKSLAPLALPQALPSPALPASTLTVLAPPNPWSLVLHGEKEQASPQAGKPANGEEVAVLAIASEAPKAGQLVEVPPVSQPARMPGNSSAAAHSEPSNERPAPGSGASTVNAAARAAQPARGGATQASRGDGPQVAHSGDEAPSQSSPGTLSGGNSSAPQTAGKASGGMPGPARVRVTPLGRVQILDLPGGAQHWQFPAGGAFDVVIVQPSAGATIPDAERLLTGHPVHTVYIALDTGQDWILQYCLPPSATAPTQSGMVVTLGPEPKLDAPFIQQAVVPPPALMRRPHPALFQAVLDRDGRLARLRPVQDSTYTLSTELLPYLEQWRFRPAKLDGVATEVDVLLFVPSTASR